MFKISEDSGHEQCLVIIQCDSGHLNGNLIACARYRIYDLRAKADDKQTTHVLFIIHLPHQHVANSSFVGFQGDPWISSHIDDLRPTSGTGVSAYEAIGLTISELFLGRPKTKPHLQAEGRHFAGVERQLRSQEHQREKPNQGDGIEKDALVSWEESEEVTGKQEYWAESVHTQESGKMEISSSSQVSSKFPRMTLDDVEQFEFEDLQPHSASPKPEEENNATVPVGVSTNRAPRSGASPKLNAAFSLGSPGMVEPRREKPLPSRSPLFKRLHGCIQAAASRLKDFTSKRSTKRVEILVHLIPKDPLPVPGL